MSSANTGQNIETGKISKVFRELNGDTYFEKYGIDVIMSLFIICVFMLMYLMLKISNNRNYYIHGTYKDKNGKTQSV